MFYERNFVEMKKIFVPAVASMVLFAVSGCTSTITSYDENGNIIRTEKATNFSRAMDGTNSKSQMVLIDGSFIAFEASASAGENCTPGVSVKYANGRTALLNCRDQAGFSGSAETVGSFFSGGVSISRDGIKADR